MIIRSDGPVHLRAGGEPGLDGAAGEPVGVGALGGGGPSDEHAGFSHAGGPAAKPKKTGAERFKKPLTHFPYLVALFVPNLPAATMRDEYIREAQKVISDPNVLINVISRRVKQLRRGSRPLVESLEKLSPEDVALREVIEGKISYELHTA